MRGHHSSRSVALACGVLLALALTANRAATTEPLPPRHLPVFAARTFGVVWRLPNAYTFNYTAFIDSFFTPEQEKWLEHYKHPPSKKARQKNG